MNVNKQPYKTGLEKKTSSHWYKKSANIIVTLFLTIAIALAVVIGAQAFEIADLLGTTDGGVLSVPGDYPTIQGAINAANPGEIVRVSPGVYNENLILSKPVSLIATTFDTINPSEASDS